MTHNWQQLEITWYENRLLLATVCWGWEGELASQVMRRTPWKDLGHTDKNITLIPL